MMRVSAGAFLVLMGSALIWSGCLGEPYNGSTVTVDFRTDLEANTLVRMPDGSTTHYEMWVSIQDWGVISLGRFIVDTNKHVMSYPSQAERLGSVTGADDSRRSGVDFLTDYDLSQVDYAFVTAEPNGETDYAPSDYVIMSGTIARSGSSVLRGDMNGHYVTRTREEKNPTASVAIVLTQDEVVF
jgi:hypothetical protein